jgi:hypothetical protein
LFVVRMSSSSCFSTSLSIPPSLLSTTPTHRLFRPPDSSDSVATPTSAVWTASRCPPRRWRIATRIASAAPRYLPRLIFSSRPSIDTLTHRQTYRGQTHTGILIVSDTHSHDSRAFVMPLRFLLECSPRVFTLVFILS